VIKSKILTSGQLGKKGVFLDKDGLENGTPFLFSEAYLTVGWT
jgi:hypothetical protein